MFVSGRPARGAGPDPAVEAQRLLATLDTPETRLVVQQPLAKSKLALERAHSARAAGDLQHATELDSLALTWAEVASDLVRTAAAEKKLAELQKVVTDLEQKAVRTQALIEQTIARRGRAEQDLKSASGSAVAPNKSVVAKPSKEAVPAVKVKPGNAAGKK